jgi:hypothetical protein
MWKGSWEGVAKCDLFQGHLEDQGIMVDVELKNRVRA